MRTVSSMRSPATKRCRCSSTSSCASASPPPTPAPPSACSPAIGEPELVDTRNDPRLSRIFGNRVIRRYPAFREFYGMEDAIEQIVAFFKHAAQGLEESKQILYLLGPGRRRQVLDRRAAEGGDGAASDLRAQGLAGQRVAARACSRPSAYGAVLEDEYGIPRRYLTGIMSPWAIKRLAGVRRRHVASSASCASSRRCCARSRSPRPSRATRTTRTSRRSSARSTSASSSVCRRTIPDAYSYSGGLCLANQGLLEFVEMFKAPIKMLHPLLTATQEGNFKGTEGFSAIPFNGAHPRALERVASGTRSATTRTTRRSSTGSTSSRCRTACGCPRR